MVVQLTTMKQPPLSKPIFLLDAKEVLAPECGIGRTLPTIPCGHPPASLAPQAGKCTAHTIKSRNNHQVDPLASALCAHFCNYTLLLWKPKTFGSSSTQPLSPPPVLITSLITWKEGTARYFLFNTGCDHNTADTLFLEGAWNKVSEI